MKVEDGSLRIRSTRTAHAYVGRDAAALTDADGFVDTGDMVELRGDRYHFVGRRGGIINIGGLKVHPEEIEAVINRHPRSADVARQIAQEPDHRLDRGRRCHSRRWLRFRAGAAISATKSWPIAGHQLAPHKVPAMIKFVPALDITAAGKLARSDA